MLGVVMSEDFKQFTTIILDQLSRQDQDHRDLMSEIGKIRDEQVEQGKTLVRNTVSLEEHIRRTDLLEVKVERVDKKVDDVEEEVDGLHKHLVRLDGLFDFFKPTKTKIKWLITILSALGIGFGGVELSKESTQNQVKSVIEKTLD